MNFAELAAKAAAGSGVSPAKAEDVLVVAFDAMVTELAAGYSVDLRWFGRFQAVPRAARFGRNPRTGADMHIPATTTVRFTPGARLKDAVGGGGDPKVREPLKLSIER